MVSSHFESPTSFQIFNQTPLAICTLLSCQGSKTHPSQKRLLYSVLSRWPDKFISIGVHSYFLQSDEAKSEFIVPKSANTTQKVSEYKDSNHKEILNWQGILLVDQFWKKWLIPAVWKNSRSFCSIYGTISTIAHETFRVRLSDKLIALLVLEFPLQDKPLIKWPILWIWQRITR